MLDNTRGEQAAKIHRQMHAPIMRDSDITVHMDKEQDVSIQPRKQRMVGKIVGQETDAGQSISLSDVDKRIKVRKGDNIDKQSERLTAKEIKEQEIKKALNVAAKKDSDYKKAKKARGAKRSNEMTFGFRRMVLAMACAAAAVFAIVYFVNLNATDVSLKVTAMQTGLEASYPSYIPRDYSLSDITSENGKIIMNFKNSSSGDAYMLTEEASSWDSAALLNGYVKDEFGENYVTLKEQGLTIYVSNSNAAWVNGGILFKIKTVSGSLTKKQIQTIATSL